MQWKSAKYSNRKGIAVHVFQMSKNPNAEDVHFNRPSKFVFKDFQLKSQEGHVCADPNIVVSSAIGYFLLSTLLKVLNASFNQIISAMYYHLTPPGVPIHPFTHPPQYSTTVLHPSKDGFLFPGKILFFKQFPIRF